MKGLGLTRVERNNLEEMDCGHRTAVTPLPSRSIGKARLATAMDHDPTEVLHLSPD